MQVSELTDSKLDKFRKRGKIYTHISETTDLSFGDFIVIDPMTMGKGTPIQKIGRLVQIRKKRGAFGSDLFLYRCPDATLRRVENAAIFKLCEEDSRIVRSLFTKELLEWDTEDTTYTLNLEYPQQGFIINEEGCKPYDEVNSWMVVATSKDENKITLSIPGSR